MAIQLLIAENHALVRQGIRVTFENTEIQIVGEATTGEEAVRLASLGNTDVVLLDVTFPNADGFGVLKKIKSANPENAVLMFSQNERADLKNRARELGASGYLSKRANAKELIDAVRKAGRGDSLWPISDGGNERDRNEN